MKTLNTFCPTTDPYQTEIHSHFRLILFILQPCNINIMVCSLPLLRHVVIPCALWVTLSLVAVLFVLAFSIGDSFTSASHQAEYRYLLLKCALSF